MFELIWINDSNKKLSTKINKLGWKPAITLDQGIAATVEWYQENK